MSSIRTSVCFALCLMSGCVDGLARPEPNRAPVAVATVEGREGSSVTIPFTGTPVEITLDASGSTDPDGPLAAYRWLSGSSAVDRSDDDDAGSDDPSGRWVPSGAPRDWPEDVEKPVVELGEGEYAFVLWVIDSEGVVSDPSTLHVTVTRPLDPPVQACVDDVLESVALPCKSCVCGVSDACRAAAIESECGADCWGLIRCIADKCPGFMTGGDTSCIISSCMTFLGGVAGSSQLAPCLAPCAASCRPE